MIIKEQLLELGFVDCPGNYMSLVISNRITIDYCAESFELSFEECDESPRGYYDTHLSVHSLSDLQTLIKILSNGK